jgi:hypothetical protein
MVLTILAPDRATLSIPEQGLTDAPLKDVQITAEAMTFRLHVPPMPEAAAARFALKLDATGTAASGVMQQGPASIPLTLKRLAPSDEPGLKRPQTPRAPFPYTSEELTFTNAATSGTLVGTLTLPEARFAKDGKHAAVVLVSGSGGQDRDSTIFGHKPFWVLADALTRAGVAVLRVDDPGVGKSSNPYGPNGREGTTEKYVLDVFSAVAALRARSDIDKARIGLIGHSEGGILAAMAAAAGPSEVRYIVMLAGTGVRGDEVLTSQQMAINRASGMPDADLARSEKLQRQALALAASDKPEAELREALAKLAEDSMTGDKSIDDQQRKALTGPALLQPWVRAFVRLDPREFLRLVNVPVLVLNGSLDVQVVPSINVPGIAAALAEANNPDVTIRIMPGLNHLFQPASTGLVSEYGTIETTLAPEALEEITRWVTRRAGVNP